MDSAYINSKASEDFNKARTRELLSRIFNILNMDDQELLSLVDVRALLKPRGESYRGMQVVPVSLIVGSEGRYRDFNKWFFPRYDHMRNRWERVDKAHLTSIVLPPIKLYEIGGVYFVRDGNHRVSVAKTQGIEMIDAEVVSLSSEIFLEPGMTREDLKEKIVEYERHQFNEQTGFDRIIGDPDFRFTAAGRYDEILKHIEVHKYYINEKQKEEIPFENAMVSWYNNVYRPISQVIDEERLLMRFPGRSSADLYVWIVKHWDELKRKYGHNYPVKEAAKDFSRQFGKSLWQQFREIVKRLFVLIVKRLRGR